MVLVNSFLESGRSILDVAFLVFFELLVGPPSCYRSTPFRSQPSPAQTTADRGGQVIGLGRKERNAATVAKNITPPPERLVTRERR
eukprot:709316-Pyramimonas_sp.AAC.1